MVDEGQGVYSGADQSSQKAIVYKEKNLLPQHLHQIDLN